MAREDKGKKGILLVVSGPSGAGKGTICQRLRKLQPELGYSVSVTTRKPRAGETNGVDYFFKTVDEFNAMIAARELLEYAEVYGNYYGTPRKYVQELLDAGKDVLLEIDIQGALQVKERFPEGVLVFVVPPSLGELCARIRKRGTDSEDVIEQRMAGASEELAYAKKYDYIVLNDEVESAVRKTLTIVSAEKCKASRNYFIVEAIRAKGEN